MSSIQSIVDRFEIEALRGEFTDSVMMRDPDRLASLFTEDGVWRIPGAGVELTGREQIRDGSKRLQSQWDFFVQTTHPGTIQIDGDAAAGRAYISELASLQDGRSGLNYAVYHETATSAQRTAGSSPSASTKSDTSTPHRFRDRRKSNHMSRNRCSRRPAAGRQLLKCKYPFGANWLIKG